MPLTFRRNEAHLNGGCAAEDALTLAEWLVKRKRPKVNLASCTHLHSSVLQTLLAYRPAVSRGPRDPFLARWVAPILTAPHAEGGVAEPEAPRRVKRERRGRSSAGTVRGPRRDLDHAVQATERVSQTDMT